MLDTLPDTAEKVGLLGSAQTNRSGVLPLPPRWLSHDRFEKFLVEQTEEDDSRESSLDEKPWKSEQGLADGLKLAGHPNSFWLRALRRHAWVAPVGVVLVILIFLATFEFGHTNAFSRTAFVSKLQEVTMDHAFNGTFRVDRKSFEWLAEGEAAF
jgi:hypothetical protein